MLKRKPTRLLKPDDREEYFELRNAQQANKPGECGITSPVKWSNRCAA
jgi:hypothetical protein